jgi:hypothetical protein
MYYVVSHEEWGRQVSTDERRRWLGHRRALAYKWAAYNIDNDRELVLEARLFRMAGAAWEKVEVQPSEFHGTRDDEIRQALEMPNKWREAIRCYFRAAATALRSSDWESYDRVHESWREEELQWGERINPNLPSPMDLDAGSDLQRIRRCWETYRHEIFADRYVNFPQVIADTYEEEARQLAELQRLYASRGDRKHARVMEHQRMQLHRRSARERSAWTTWLTRTLYQYLTKSGTSVRRTVASVAVLNLLVFPIAYLVADAISKSGSGRIGWPDAMIYSSSTMLSFAAPQYAATGAAVPIIQDIQALLGYISLGYILWLVLRSYQE